MKTLWGIALLFVAWVVSARAGTIIGTVRAEGKAEVAGDAADAAYASRKFKFAERVNYAEMRDFVVYLVGPVGTNAAPPEKPAQVITTKKVSQRGAMFSPHVLPVVAGTTVEWPNYDEILHNVFSISESNSFDLDLYKAPVVKSWKFEKPGRVDVFCSIHTTMNCVVLVLENPYFAATEAQGRYAIANVPAGKYQLKAWHERLPAQMREINVPESGEVKADFTLGIKGLPKL